MAYWRLNSPSAKHRVCPTINQPTGFRGLRDATRPPTRAAGTSAKRKEGNSRGAVCRLRAKSTKAQQIRVSVRTHRVQANQAAVRRRFPPSPRPCSLVPSVTTPLYRKIVSGALRHSLRGKTFRGFLAAQGFRGRELLSCSPQRPVRSLIGGHNDAISKQNPAPVAELLPGEYAVLKQ